MVFHLKVPGRFWGLVGFILTAEKTTDNWYNVLYLPKRNYTNTFDKLRSALLTTQDTVASSLFVEYQLAPTKFNDRWSATSTSKLFWWDHCPGIDVFFKLSVLLHIQMLITTNFNGKQVFPLKEWSTYHWSALLM